MIFNLSPRTSVFEHFIELENYKRLCLYSVVDLYDNTTDANGIFVTDPYIKTTLL